MFYKVVSKLCTGKIQLLKFYEECYICREAHKNHLEYKALALDAVSDVISIFLNLIP